jgi:hypothetical protein
MDGSIGYPDGIIVYSPGVLLVVENDGGKSVALHDGDAFIVESRFDHFFGIDKTPADVPFRVKRLWLRE